MKAEECIGDILPMNEEEKNLLKYIYTRRLKFMLGIIPGIIFANLYLRYKGESWIGSILIAPIELVLFVGCIAIYFRRIHTLIIDYKRGIKEAIFYQIIRKQYMEHTGQYFVALNSSEHLFHEVDKDIWMQCEVGDTFIIYRTPKAKYYFNSQGKFELL